MGAADKAVLGPRNVQQPNFTGQVATVDQDFLARLDKGIEVVESNPRLDLVDQGVRVGDPLQGRFFVAFVPQIGEADEIDVEIVDHLDQL